MIEERLAALVREAVATADLGLDPQDVPEPEILAPKQKEHGDFATNVALALAKRAGRPPREVAAAILDALPVGGDLIERGDVDLVINTPTGTEARTDGWEIRRTAVARGVPCITTVSGGMAAARAIAADRVGGPPVVSLQELHRNGTATHA